MEAVEPKVASVMVRERVCDVGGCFGTGGRLDGKKVVVAVKISWSLSTSKNDPVSLGTSEPLLGGNGYKRILLHASPRISGEGLGHGRLIPAISL